MYGYKKIENYRSCVLEAEVEVDRQAAVILAPSILHYVIGVSHFASLST